MPGRIGVVNFLLPGLAALASLLAPGHAAAHRLDAEVLVLPGRQLQVEGWFSDGYPARGAEVEVFGQQSELLTEGRLNDQGVVVLPLGETTPVRVVISAGAGHRKEVTISVIAFARAVAEGTTQSGPPTPSREASFTAIPVADRDSRFPIKDVMVGIGFVLALAAFVLSLRNAHKLRKLAGMERREN
jgi:nickel transport protein